MAGRDGEPLWHEFWSAACDDTAWPGASAYCIFTAAVFAALDRLFLDPRADGAEAVAKRCNRSLDGFRLQRTKKTSHPTALTPDTGSSAGFLFPFRIFYFHVILWVG